MSATAEYHSEFSYDPAGNIQRLKRSGYTKSLSVQAMDDQLYHYQSGTNRLEYVDDAIGAGDWTEDIDDQSPGTYVYDGSGNVIRDKSANTWVRWNGAGKVEEVKQRKTGQYQTVKYLYNAAGNRVRKVVINDADSGDARVTFYVRDANEEVVAIYEGD